MLLIAFSKGFAKKTLFIEKVERLTKNLGDIRIALLNDERGFARDHFGHKVVEEYRFSDERRSEVKRILNGVTHVIVFWAGNDLCDLIYLSALHNKALKIVPVEITKVVNKDKGEKFDVYIGRSTPWGNPFAIGQSGMTRDEVIEKYKTYFVSEILSDDVRRKDLLGLKGKTLGCHCKPLPCHGDVIAEYLNSLDEEPPF